MFDHITQEQRDEARQFAVRKLFAKNIGAIATCMMLAVFCIAYFGKFNALAATPLIVMLLPAYILCSHIYTYRKGIMYSRTARLVSRKRDIVGGILRSVSVSKMAYTFSYEDDEGNEFSFTITRSARFSGFTVGNYYEILYNGRHPLDSGNFIDFGEIKPQEGSPDLPDRDDSDFEEHIR